jgi:hypothetical protein
LAAGGDESVVGAEGDRGCAAGMARLHDEFGSLRGGAGASEKE